MLRKPWNWRLTLAGGLVICAALGAVAEYEWQSHRGYEKAFRLARTVGVELPMTHDLSTLVASHWDTRDKIIRFQESQVPKGSVLLLGDSIIEGLRAEDVLVRTRHCITVNAGFAGIGAQDLDLHVHRVIPQLSPRFVVLSVGMNDAWADADVSEWSASYEKLLTDVLESGATVIAVTIDRVEAGHPNVIKSNATVDRFNAEIRRIAKRHDVIVADVARDVEAARLQGLRSPITIDGIHPTGPFFRQLEADWIDPAIEQAESKRGEQCITAT